MHTLVIPGAKITDEGIRCLAAHNKKLVRLELFQVRLLCHSLCSALFFVFVPLGCRLPYKLTPSASYSLET